METATNAPIPGSPPRRRLPLAQMLFAIAGIALLVVAGAYTLRFLSATAFHKERAFRVLDEVGNQLDNLQRTLTNQLRLMPPQLAGRDCAKAFMSAPDVQGPPERVAVQCNEHKRNYARRLALQGPNVGSARIDQGLHGRVCGEAPPGNQYAFLVRAHQPAAPFTAFSCSAETIERAAPSNPDGNPHLYMVGFTGSLTETIENFVSQVFFDEIIVALEDGTVVATVPRRTVSKSTDIQLHPQRARRLGVTNVAAMLRRASEAGQSEDGAKKQAASQPVAAAIPMPSQPAVFPAKIAGENYRVFVSVLRPVYGIYVDLSYFIAGGQPASRQEKLYLVGLKHDDLRADVAGSMEPGGRFLLTILVLLALLVWPLANLRAKSPDDPISWMEAIACLTSIVFIPAVLAITAVWVWSYQGLLSWTDAGAQGYARELASVLNTELGHGRQMLVQYRTLYDRGTTQIWNEPTKEIAAPIRYDGANAFYAEATPSRCDPQLDHTCTLEATAIGPHNKWGAWSPFSSVFATAPDGIRDGLRFTVYDAPLIKSDANYSSREYFRALQREQGWAVHAVGTQTPADSYVAQRIFSGGDGSRVLQVAVPRCRDEARGGAFCGIITGSLSVHSLSASVPPPLLKFAVIDQNSGLVIYHTDDSRSLAENFFVETERNPQLQALAAIGQSAAFGGYYMGSAHRFYHLPAGNAPWSVVVFYSLQEVGDLSWHAVLTALAAYSGALLIILIASGLVLWLWSMRSKEGVRNLAARFWHRIGRSCSYASWGLALFAAAMVFVTAYEIRAEGPVSPITYVMWVVLAAAFVVIVVQHKRASHSTCIAIWLLLISGIPAAWMALGYHDVQLQGLLRDGLVTAGRDIGRRDAIIASDLRRWSSEGRSNFPDPRTLAQPSSMMQVPGYSARSCHSPAGSQKQGEWVMCVFGAAPLATLITKRELDFWRRETWDAAVQAEAQQRRIRLLGKTQGYPACASTLHTEQCEFRTDEGRTLTVRAELNERNVENTSAQDDDGLFDFASRYVVNAAVILLAMVITWLLALFATRRLLGVSARHCQQTPEAGPLVHRSIVFHTRGLTQDAIERILAAAPARASTDANQPQTVKRVNLATNALFSELAPDKQLAGPLVLTNLDIALTDASRRRDILGALERLVDQPAVQIVLLSRRSPIERLYHPERYPESGPDHVLSLDEALRWDNVFQKLECRDVADADHPRSHPHLSAVDHHRIWKLCTRAERLLLYQLATNRLANPRNHAVIDVLIARGLVKLDPWPKIADESFESFVRTAETSKDIGQWQRDASRVSGKRARTVIIATVLVVLLIVVLWFSWAAGDQFKIISAIVAASVAFLGQIGQAFNFVRTGAAGGRSG